MGARGFLVSFALFGTILFTLPPPTIITTTTTTTITTTIKLDLNLIKKWL